MKKEIKKKMNNNTKIKSRVSKHNLKSKQKKTSGGIRRLKHAIYSIISISGIKTSCDFDSLKLVPSSPTLSIENLQPAYNQKMAENIDPAFPIEMDYSKIFNGGGSLVTIVTYWVRIEEDDFGLRASVYPAQDYLDKRLLKTSDKFYSLNTDGSLSGSASHYYSFNKYYPLRNGDWVFHAFLTYSLVYDLNPVKHCRRFMKFVTVLSKPVDYSNQNLPSLFSSDYDYPNMKQVFNARFDPNVKLLTRFDVNLDFLQTDRDKKIFEIISIGMSGTGYVLKEMETYRKSFMNFNWVQDFSTKFLGGNPSVNNFKMFLNSFTDNGLRTTTNVLGDYLQNSLEKPFIQLGTTYEEPVQFTTTFNINFFLEQDPPTLCEQNTVFILFHNKVDSSGTSQKRIFKLLLRPYRLDTGLVYFKIRVFLYDNVIVANQEKEQQRFVHSQLSSRSRLTQYKVNLGVNLTPTYLGSANGEESWIDATDTGDRGMALIIRYFVSVEALDAGASYSYNYNGGTEAALVGYYMSEAAEIGYEYYVDQGMNDYNIKSYVSQYFTVRGGVFAFLIRKISLDSLEIDGEIVPVTKNPDCNVGFLGVGARCVACYDKDSQGRYLFLDDSGKCQACSLDNCQKCYDSSTCSRCFVDNSFRDPFRRGKCLETSERCPHNQGAFSPVMAGIVSNHYQTFCLTCRDNCRKCFDFSSQHQLCSECFHPMVSMKESAPQKKGVCTCVTLYCKTCERYNCDTCIPGFGYALTLVGGTSEDDNPTFECYSKDVNSKCMGFGTFSVFYPSSFSATDKQEDYFCYDPDINSGQFLPGNQLDAANIDETSPYYNLAMLNLTDLDQQNPLTDPQTGNNFNCNSRDTEYFPYKFGGNQECKSLSLEEWEFGCLRKNFTNDCLECEGDAVPRRVDSMRLKCGCPLKKYFDEDLKECRDCPGKCDICYNKNECVKCKVGATIKTDLTCECDLDNCRDCPDESGREICRRCYSPFAVKDGACLELCGDSYRMKTIDEVDTCIPCEVASCFDCASAPEGECQTCENTFFLSADKRSCTVSCLPGEYPADLISRTCLKCPSPHCEECDRDNPDTCLRCFPDQYLQLDDTCSDSCPIGYAKNSLSRTCDECSIANCEICEGGSECSKCLEGFFKSFNDLECKSSCSSDEYPYISNEAENRCIPCDKESRFYKLFNGCLECSYNPDGGLACPEESSFSLAQPVFDKSKTTLKIIVEPRVPDSVIEDGLPSQDLKSFFKLEIYSEDSQENPRRLTIRNASIDSQGGEGRSTITLEIENEIADEKFMNVTLNTEDGYKVLYKSQSTPVSGPATFIFFLKGPKKMDIIQLSKGLSKAVTESVNLNDNVVGAVAAADPTGATIRASQMLKLINKFVFLDIDYSPDMRTFLEECAKLEHGYKKRGKNAEFSNGYKGKFSLYDVSLRLEGPLAFNIYLYLSSWALRVIEALILWSIWRKGKKPNKVVSGVLKVSRIIKFSIFCSFGPKILFLGTRVILHAIPRKDILYEKAAVAFTITLITLEFVMFFDVIRRVLKYGLQNEKAKENKGENGDVANETMTKLNRERGIGGGLDRNIGESRGRRRDRATSRGRLNRIFQIGAPNSGKLGVFLIPK